MTAPGSDDIIQGYTKWFGAPARILDQTVDQPPIVMVRVPVYLPVDEEDDTTMIGTAGLCAVPIGEGVKAELAMEVKGALDKPAVAKLAEALIDIGLAPLKTGRRFAMDQILTNLTLPSFSRFHTALLIDWDPVNGFVFPQVREPVSLLRVVPLFEDEAREIEAAADRKAAYLALRNRGLEPEDFERESTAGDA
jgi:hypothetical protein